MANEGIFITKPGVTVPVANEMSAATWAAYANNLVLALLKNTNQVIDAFEAFKFRAYITDLDGGPNPTVLFNNKTNYTPNFILGSGSLNTSTGVITPTTVPLEVEELNKVFLTGAEVQISWPDTGENEKLRIASINGLAHYLWDIPNDNVVITHPVDGTSNGTGELASAAGNQVIEILEDAVNFISNGVEVYSAARTWRLKLSAAGLGDLDSNNTQTGNWLPFSSSETLDSANSVIEGTLTVESAFGQSTDYDLKLGDEFVDAPSPIVQSTTANQSYVDDVNDHFSGGVGNLGYAIQSGNLPSGVNLTSNGVLQGVPMAEGSYAFVVRVTDERGETSDVTYDLTVLPASEVDYSPVVGIETVPYDYSPFVPGITGAVVSAGSLPPGLSLSPTTGAITGTPSADGNYDVTITLTVNGEDEDITTTIIIYPFMTVEHFEDGVSQGFVTTGQEVSINSNKNNQLVVAGGSGQFQYTISGDNIISSQGVLQIFEAGEVLVSITDIVSGQLVLLTLLVAGQNDICGLAVEEDAEAQSDSGPCVDVLTDCDTPVTIAFNALTLLRGVEAGAVTYREALRFTEMEGASITNNKKYFAMFRSTADDGFAVAENARDGRPFLLEMAVEASVANATTDVVVGTARSYDNQGLAGLDFAMAFTTVGGIRYVELRKNNVYQSGSRFAILEGQQAGFAVYDDTIILYVDGLIKFSLTGNTFACAGVDLIFFAESENVIIGGRASNLVFDIETAGNIDEVGTIDAQTGLYTPAKNNVGLVRIKATSTANPDAIYHAKVRVLKPAVKASFEKAMIEGVPVDMWICGPNRFDDLPLRLDRQGRPDRNQVDDPRHLGTLAGSGRIETTVTRNEFRNDRGATSTSLTMDKVVISGAYLNVRDFATTKRLIPFMKELNRNGVRTLRQYSSGCQKKMRILLVWETPDCEDVTVYDAIEVFNGLSYTPFNLEVGQSVQSQIPLTIEGFPDANSALFDYNQYDKHFHRIGA